MNGAEDLNQLSPPPASCLLHSTEHAQRPPITNCLSDITAQRLFNLKGKATNFSHENVLTGLGEYHCTLEEVV